MTPPTLWIVTPVYMDVESFLILRHNLCSAVERMGTLPSVRVHFVVVDDTAGLDHEIARLHGIAGVDVIVPPFNLGHQRAIVYGLRKVSPKIADDDIVVTMDADGQDKPDDLPRLLEPLLAGMNRVDLALAHRTKRQETAVFRLMYICFRLLFYSLTGTAVRTGNFAAMRGGLVRRIMVHPDFDLSYSSTLISLQLPARFVDCGRGARYAGQSRMNYSRLITHGLRMLMPFTDRIAIRALIAFSITFALAVCASIVVLALRLFTTLAIPGWATSTLLLVFLLSFVALGNFVVLFTVFGQSRSISLANLESVEIERSRKPR